MAMKTMADAPMAGAPEGQTSHMVTAPASTVSSLVQPSRERLLVRVLRPFSRLVMRC